MNTGIYRILNLENGMSYVGQAYIFHKRWKNHKIYLNLNRHPNLYLQSAWNKYGEDKFEFEILELCEKDRLTELEQFWMDFYQSADRTKGYNLAPSAGSSLGLKHSDETKAMWSAMRKGKLKHTEEAKAKIAEASRNRVFSAESREKMRQSQLGKKQSEATKAKRVELMKGNTFNTGRKQTSEEIANRVAANTGKKRTPEQRARMSASHKGRIVSEETRARMSEAAKNRRR